MVCGTYQNFRLNIQLPQSVYQDLNIQIIVILNF